MRPEVARLLRMEHSKKFDLSISAADLERIEQILDYHFSRPERVPWP